MIQALCHVNLSRGYRGGERQTELLIRELSKNGIRQRALVHKNGQLARLLVDVQGLYLRPAGAPFLHHARFTRNCLMHAHEARARHFAHLCNRLTGAPYLFTRRVDDVPADRYLTRQSFLCAAQAVAISRAVAHTLETYLPALRVGVIPSACTSVFADETEIKKLRETFKGYFVIGHLGCLVDAHKGQSVLIEAARLLQDKFPNLLYVLLGSGPDEAALKAQARDMNNIRFIGQVNQPQNYLAAFDLFAFPSRHEGLGSAVLDAMHAGLAVIASDVDGLPEIVAHEKTGLLVPPGDAQALAEAIECLYLDADRRERLAVAGRKRAEDFSPARMVDSYLALYRRLAPELFA